MLHLHLGDKSASKSVTIIAAAIIAAIQAAEGCGVIPPGTFHYLAVAGQALATIAVAFGLRRAISTNGLGQALQLLDGLAEMEKIAGEEEASSCTGCATIDCMGAEVEGSCCRATSLPYDQED